jgi:hypothetical protein
MIVETGSVSMDLDVNRLNGITTSTEDTAQIHFATAANSFFPVVVFDDQLRAIAPGSMALIRANSVEAAVPAAGISGSQATRMPLQNLPAALNASLNRLVITNFLLARASISRCATTTRDSRFSILKDRITITTPIRSCLPSPEADCSFQKSLPMLLADRQTPGR